MMGTNTMIKLRNSLSKMKVFLDTNVLIDIAEDRDNARLTETILNLGKAGKIQNCVSYLSYANIN